MLIIHGYPYPQKVQIQICKIRIRADTDTNVDIDFVNVVDIYTSMIVFLNSVTDTNIHIDEYFFGCGFGYDIRIGDCDFLLLTLKLKNYMRNMDELFC